MHIIKPRLMVFLLTCASCAPYCTAQEEEVHPIVQSVDKAREAFTERQLQARSNLEQAIQLKVEQAADSGDLNRVETLRVELMNLKEKQTLPSERSLAGEVATYRRGQQKALRDFIKELETAQVELTKLRKFDLARGIRDEIEKLRASDSNEMSIISPEKISQDSLKKEPGFRLDIIYEDPELDYIYESWTYIIPRDDDHHLVRLIHCTHGEVYYGGSSGGAKWCNLRVDQQGYFFIGASTSRNANVTFVIKRLREGSE